MRGAAGGEPHSFLLQQKAAPKENQGTGELCPEGSESTHFYFHFVAIIAFRFLKKVMACRCQPTLRGLRTHNCHGPQRHRKRGSRKRLGGWDRGRDENQQQRRSANDEECFRVCTWATVCSPCMFTPLTNRPKEGPLLGRMKHFESQTPSPRSTAF